MTRFELRRKWRILDSGGAKTRQRRAGDNNLYNYITTFFNFEIQNIQTKFYYKKR